jgi:hypothetical protein
MRIIGLSREEYFAYDAISNSKLNEVDLNDGKFKIPTSQGALGFGSLVDAILTQRQDVDSSHPEFSKASKMVELFLKDPECRGIYENAYKQVMHTSTVTGFHQEQHVEGFCKCLYDFDLSDRSGWDLKTGSYSGQDGFLKLIDTFNWDQQAAFYMDVSGKQMHGIMALSKLALRPPNKVVIKKGDPLYMRGRAKYMEKMWMLNLIKE